MKTMAFFLVFLFGGIGLMELSAQKSDAKGVTTNLGWPSPLYDILNGRVEKVILRSYWNSGTGETFSKGRPITAKELDSLNWFYNFEATFDRTGDHVITFKFLDENDKIITSYQCFRENNKIVLAKWTMTKDNLIEGSLYRKGDGYTKFVYDSNGYKIANEDYKSEGDVLLYKYPAINNASGDPVEVRALDSNGNLVSRWTTTYNEKRQVTGGEFYGKDGLLAGSSKSSYNDKGKVSEITNYDKDKNVKLVNYIKYPEWDSMDNWLRLNFKNTKGQSVILERTITYFK